MNSAGGHQPIRATVYSDASVKGWGGAVFNGSSTGGHWSLEEAAHHIKYLELLAVFFAIKAYATSLLHQHVRIMIDNTAAVGLINNMGTCHSDDCHDLTIDLWQFCIQKGIWLTATHLPGSTNTVADSESRSFVKQDTEWMLNPSSLKFALDILGFQPNIDLFASRLNHQLSQNCSYRPDPEALYIDACSISWSCHNFYCFPLFSCILTAIQKI